MNLRHLTLALPLVLLAACNQPAEEAPVATPATPVADAATPAPDTSADAAPPADAAPAAPAQLDAKANLVPGVDYAVIEGGQPLQPLDGKVEVVEVFAYWCGHCAAFEPSLKAWKAKLPADVRFTPIPLGGGAADTLARVYYAAETTGQLGKVHDAMFSAIHHERALQPNAGQDQIVDYLGKKGVDVQSLGAAMSSFAMGARLSQGMQFAQRSGVEGTPTLIVNGKYRILGRTQDEQLQIANALINQERAAGGN